MLVLKKLGAAPVYKTSFINVILPICFCRALMFNSQCLSLTAGDNSIGIY